MMVFKSLNLFNRSRTQSPHGSQESSLRPRDDDKHPTTNSTEANTEQSTTEVTPQTPGENAQGGVQRVEAITLSWSKSSLIVVYAFMFLLYFTNAFQASITSNLTPYVLSGFESHSLIPVIYVVSNVMSGAFYLPIAKMLDLWGRSEGFLVMTTVATIGLILMAVCDNVQTFGAAQVFYSVGFSGMIYSIDVITSDTSTLRDRGLAYAFTASPYIITAFAGPSAAEGFYEDISWRWAFGTFAIVLPVVAMPLYLTLQINQRKAIKNGLLRRGPSGRTLVQSIWHYAIEFDALGVFLLAAGLVLFLLPFSLADSMADGWRSASIISMLVVGVVLLLSFALSQRFIAPRPFLPYRLLTSRTIIGTCLLCATYQVAYYCWASYFSSYLQVVNGLTIAQAGYIGGIFDIISGLWLLFIGFLIRLTGRFKWLLMCAVPLYILGVGLMIHFRRPHTNIGYIVMCQIFIAFAGGTIINCQQVSVLSVADHGQVAAVLALLGLFGYMGGAVGNTISGAIWTNTLPQELERLLPDSVQDQAADIYGDLSLQLSFEMGDPVREAIIQAYGIAQQRMLIAGTAIMALSLIWVILIKNVNVAKIEQVKGVLF